MPLTQPLKTANDLVIIRISDSKNHEELAKKARETGHRYRDLPGAEVIAQLADRPLRDPSCVDGRVHNPPGLRSVLYRVPGTGTPAVLANAQTDSIALEGKPPTARFASTSTRSVPASLIRSTASLTNSSMGTPRATRKGLRRLLRSRASKFQVDFGADGHGTVEGFRSVCP